MSERKKPQDKLAGLQKTVEDLMREKGAEYGDPAEFLASIVAGIDPRPIKSALYKLVKQIDESVGVDGLPDATDWSMIKHLVLDSGCYTHERVDISTSMNAALKLIEFLHPKQKAVDLSATVDATVRVLPALTDEEMDLFNQFFKENF